MTPWPTTEDDARKCLWRVHQALVDVRLAGYRRDTVAGDALLALATAIDDLLNAGSASFETRLRSFGRPFRPTPTGDESLGQATLREAEALMKAMSIVMKAVGSGSPEPAEVARVADELEYLPCEYLRIGPTAITDLADAANPAHLQRLAAEFKAFLGP